MDLMSTVAGSNLETFFPSGWDLGKIDSCVGEPGTETQRQSWWHDGFELVGCNSVEDFDVLMGHEIAKTIKRTRDEGKQLAIILPVGPMGMYRWAIYFLKEWGVGCDHVHGFNMDEWADADGNTLPGDAPGGFQDAMTNAFYGPLGELTVPESQRNFATKENLPTYPEKIQAVREKGELACVFGIGRVCHIAFWEPQFGGEYDSVEAWRADPYRIGAKLHPLTIEQNAITSFKSRTTLIPCFANTIGPGLFLGDAVGGPVDHIIGGCDGTLGRDMQWQGLSFWMTLRHEPSPWIPSTFMPTQAGRLFYLHDLAGPLEAGCN